MLVKEEVLSYLIKGYVHVGKKDYLFFHNLQKFIDQGKNITSKQSDLFNKLLLKYQRQLKKQNLDATILQKLDWKTKVVPTDPLLLIPCISLIDGQIVIKAPYNRKFASSFTSRFTSIQGFNWDKNNKTYVANFNTINFKYAFNRIQDCFKEYKLCPYLQSIVVDLEELKTKIWQPTLVKSHNNFYIVAMNGYLNDQIDDITNNLSLRSIFELTKLGVKIDSSIIENEVVNNFLNNYQTTVDFKEIEILFQYLDDLGIEKVYLQSNSNSFLRNSANVVLEQLKKYDIPYELLKPNFDVKVKVPNSLTIRLSKSIMTHSNIITDKVLVVANDMPIDIK